MLPINYNTLPFAIVQDTSNFYRGQQREIPRIKNAVSALKILLHIPSTSVQIQVAEESRVYKIVFFSSALSKYPLGWIVYMPQEGRVDLYDTGVSSDYPYIQWKNKKPVYKGYSQLLDIIKLDRQFMSVINVL